MQNRKPGSVNGFFSIACLSVLVLFSVINDIGTVFPLIAGCVIAGCAAFFGGCSWETIISSATEGVKECIEALFILLAIGMLTGTWVASGTVPTLICTGLRVITPKLFFAMAFLISMIMSLIMGAWGSIGSIGVVLIGIGTAMGFHAPAAAGAIVSGAYVGDKISPLSDSTNLQASIANTNIMNLVKAGIKPVAFTCIVIFAAYCVYGFKVLSGTGSGASNQIESIILQLNNHFKVHWTAVLPVAALVIALAMKVPAIPAMILGSFSAVLIAVMVQGKALSFAVSAAVNGYHIRTGNAQIDGLLNMGGITSVVETIIIVIIAMAFGGIMKGTKQYDAVTRGIVGRLKTVTGLVIATELTGIVANAVMADQYLGISLPGKMYDEEYRKRNISTAIFANVIGAGASVTSPLIPWNTCGIYVFTILGVRATEYIQYAWLNLLFPLVMIVYVSITERKEHG